MTQKRCACGCGRRFGLIVQRYYGMRFATKLCFEAYKRRLDDSTRRKIAFMQFLARS